MASSRDYAKSLVGDLDRSGYETQRNVAQNKYKTNWEDLQNQYKNLTEKLKNQQAQANEDFANGLVDVTSNSFDRMANANRNMANRGLVSSGLGNLNTQADIAQKGEDVLGLLGKQGDVTVDIATQLENASKTLANKEAQLAGDLANTLGKIGANETAAQNAYNNALSDIAASKDARDDSNDLAAKQRAASRASSGGGSNKYSKELDEFYKNLAITEILGDENLSDQQKTNSLAILYDVGNAGDALKAFKKNENATSAYEEQLKKQNDLYQKALKNESAIKTNLANSNNYIKNNYDVNGYIPSGAVNNNRTAQTVASQITTPEINYTPMSTGYKRTINDLTNAGVTYEDLARILYGE